LTLTRLCGVVFYLLKTPKEVRENIMTQCAEILACYRRNCANSSSAGQLILPESMKLLPLHTNCIIKSDALQAGSPCCAPLYPIIL